MARRGRPSDEGHLARRRAGGTQRILNCLPSPDQDEDWTIEDARDAGVAATARAALPAKVDLRATWWKVGDQGSTGSCVGWASADSVLRWHFVDAGRLSKTSPLSVRFAWAAAKETDQYSDRPTTFIEAEGTWLKAALEVARKWGAVLETDLPFSGKPYPGKAKAFYLMAANLRIGAFVNLGRNLTTWKRWLAEEGPILTRLDCDDTWMNAADTAGKLDDYKKETAEGGHAVALVGYDSSRFYVRNSWGTDWGTKGFGLASPDYAEAAFTEAYGVRL